jgi:hypothetical protein
MINNHRLHLHGQTQNVPANLQRSKGISKKESKENSCKPKVNENIEADTKK